MAYLYLKVDASKMSVADMNVVSGNLAQVSVTSTSGASTTLTVNALAHGLLAGDVAVLNGLRTSAGVAVAYVDPISSLTVPVEGPYTVATAATNSFTITIPAVLSTGQAASGQVMKNPNSFPSALNPVVNLLNGIQAGTVDGVITIASSDVNASAIPSTNGSFNYVNLK
jgi:hypothetical protein